MHKFVISFCKFHLRFFLNPILCTRFSFKSHRTLKTTQKLASSSLMSSQSSTGRLEDDCKLKPCMGRTAHGPRRAAWILIKWTGPSRARLKVEQAGPHTVSLPKLDKLKPFNLYVSHWYKFSLLSKWRYYDAQRHAVTMCVCVCVSHISLGSESNVLYPVLSS